MSGRGGRVEAEQAGQRLAALLARGREGAARGGPAAEGGDPSHAWVPLPLPDAMPAWRRAQESAADATPILLRRIAAGPRPVLLALVLCLLVGAGAVLRLALQDDASVVPVSLSAAAGSPVAEPTVEPASRSQQRSSSPAGSSDAASTDGGAGGAAEPGVVVHVVGQVRRPGVVALAAGARVVDAVTRAGGPTAAADTSRVNLARLVVDGEQVYVPKVGEVIPPQAAGPAPAGAGAPSTAGTVDLNTADAAALDALPGVGPVLAQRILGWRSGHGRFSSVDELGEVQGIGEVLLDALRPLVTLS